MMSKIGDARESVVLEKERIDKDLQQMWESLQYLKKSVENDATLLQKADFSDLLQHIVTDLSPLSQTQDMLLLQQTLQSQENLTVTDLDKIIQEFISVKLEYTANKSLHLADISLEKYKQLVEHKSSMDALLLAITQAPTIENSVPATQEQQDPRDEVVNPITETLDPDVIKAQQNLIDGQTSTPEDASKAESSKDSEDKSWWERAKDSSFGLAYVFGADNMGNFKDWVSDKWSNFKEWIGWKKKEKKEDNKEKDDNTSTESSSANEETQPSIMSFDAYQESAYNSYSNSIDKQNLDTTATVSKDMYKEVSTWLQKDRLPPLIREYDGTLDAFSWKSLAVISEHFGTIKDLTDYTFLEKAWNTATNILSWIIDFLSKHEDKKWVGWLASLIKKPFDVVLSWIPNGDEQKEKKFKENIQKEISGNADIQKDVDAFVKQLTLARFYFIEKKKIMAQDPKNKDSIDGLTIAQAMQYLSSKNMLDAKISVKTQLGIDANKATIVIQKLIAETGPSNQDLSAKRWEIRFNYEKQQLESRWKATPLEVNADGTQYKIKWLDLQFASLEEVVWLANLSNRFISDTSKMQVLRNKKSDRFVYYSNIWRPGYPGLYVNKESDNFFNILPSLDADRVLTAGALQENIKHRTSDMWNTYASYMNERVSSIKEVWL